MIIEGQQTTAEVKLPENEVNAELQEDIQEQVDHEAFQNPIKYMPDTHGGMGPQAIVGFSMELDDRVIPNTVGGDIGCGMTAARLSKNCLEGRNKDDLNDQIRRDIPMGTGKVNGKLEGDKEWYIPTRQANETLLQFFDYRERLNTAEFEHYKFDSGYFMALCKRVGISEDYAKRSLGSLGSGNHFIEISRSQSDGNPWVVVHSGSRHLGQKVCSYWQEKATEYRDGDVKWDEMSPEERTFAMSDGSPNWEKIRRTFSGEKIGEVGDGIADKNPDDTRNKDLDYLEGTEMFGYLKDMIFTQAYATFNRRLMVQAVASAVNAEIREVINSPHNYVDFEDGVIRKGSTRAAYNDRLVIPMNMKDGSLLCRGRGNPMWNRSAPHGAGRLGSRRWAHNEFDSREVREEMEADGIYSAHIPADETPGAYKDTQLIERQIETTAEVVDRLKPVMGFKA